MDEATASFTDPTITLFQDEMLIIDSGTPIPSQAHLSMILVNGQYVFGITTNGVVLISGSAEWDGSYVLLTGDCTITIRDGGGPK